ncbi:MAG: 3-deoxy-7-phosphoheptulonate synthase [Chitinivibrionales bacterium]|nr:3-deoxy-7-phosphoheptulonate synthase [Chitinivibrionales bacterium]
MVIVLKNSIKPQEKEHIRATLEQKGFTVREIVGQERTIFGAVGAVAMDQRTIEQLAGVEEVIPISKPYKLASREFRRDDTVVSVQKVKIGGGRIAVIAGPCAVESRQQILETAAAVRESGAVMLRGGAFKPRTSPYAFQGMGEEGLQYLKEAGQQYGMPIVSEIVGTQHCELMRDYVDILQIGTRNMQNFELLKKVGALGKPVILKRGMAATIQEWLMAAEYLLAHGADQVILCERGIRTFETYTRNTLDISAIPVIKKLSHLPIIVDPSHATGLREKVLPMALASIAAGADGLIIEVHIDPEKATSDGPQSLYPSQFEKLMRDLEQLAPVVGKEIEKTPRKPIPGATHLQSVSVDSKASPVTVAFQGESGAYSQIASQRYFHTTAAHASGHETFRDVFEAVLCGDCRYGIVPIENSLTGSIHENYDLLLQYPDITIVGEQILRIVHAFIAPTGASLETITTVYSHSQGLSQCSNFLDRYPQWKRVPLGNTAGSVKYIAEQANVAFAAIASQEAAQIYGMRVLADGIENNPQNYTRFVIVARSETEPVAQPTMASIVFSTTDKPGALYACLKILADAGVNMKKLESRPISGKPWEYMFYIDLEIPNQRQHFDAAIQLLSQTSENMRLLGLYCASSQH